MPAAQAPRAAVVHAEGAAVWTEHREGDRDEVVLQRGALWIHVDHASGEGRLAVVLPDGELEDIGTTFTVSAEDGRTKRVSVEEGHVLLRLRDRPVVTLGSGETWAADVPAPSACASATTPPSEPPASASRAQERSAAPPRSSAPVGPAPAVDPSADFRAAMSALDVGDNHDAATKFESFLQKHPRDPRAEDAAYLRVIALQRCGDTAAMKDAARDYLRLYPTGFRHAEVDDLAR
jgi:TolA-binding protein